MQSFRPVSWAAAHPAAPPVHIDSAEAYRNEAAVGRALAHVDVSGCEELTDVSIKAIAEHCPALVGKIVARGERSVSRPAKREDAFLL